MPNGSGYKSVESAFTSIDTIRQLREQIRSQRAELVEFEEKLRTERETHQRERQLRQHEFDKIKNSRGRALDSWDSTIISHEQQLARHRSESELKQQLSSSSLQLSSKSLENNLQQQQWSVAVEKSGKSLSTKHVFKSRDCVNDPDVASISYENLIESSGINAKSTALNQQQQVYSQKEQPPSPASSFGLETIDTRTDQTISSASKRRQRSGTMESRQHRVSIGYQYSIGSSEASSSQSSPLRTNFSVSTDLIPGTLGTLLSSMDPVSPGGGFRDGSRRVRREGGRGV